VTALLDASGAVTCSVSMTLHGPDVVPPSTSSLTVTPSGVTLMVCGAVLVPLDRDQW
jgi:hypothetical protein